MEIKKIAPFYIIFAAFLWSLDGILRRELRSIPPSSLVMLEHLVGLCIFLPFLRKSWQEYKKIQSRDWLLVITVSTLGGLLGTVCYSSALAKVNYIPYTVVILLQQTQPIIVIILARIILKEKITPRYIFFVITGTTAAYFLAFPNYRPNFVDNDQETIAAFFALGAAFCWGVSTVLGKMMLSKLNFMAASTIRFAFVIPTAFITSLFLGQTIEITQVTAAQWGYLASIAISTGAVACIFYYKGLQHTPAKISTILELTFPISAMFIGFFYLQESITIVQGVSGAILLAVVILMALRRDQKNY